MVLFSFWFRCCAITLTSCFFSVHSASVTCIDSGELGWAVESHLCLCIFDTAYLVRGMHRIVPSITRREPIVNAMRSITSLFHHRLFHFRVFFLVSIKIGFFSFLLLFVFVWWLFLRIVMRLLNNYHFGRLVLLDLRSVAWRQKRFRKLLQMRIIVKEFFVGRYRVDFEELAVLELGQWRYTFAVLESEATHLGAASTRQDSLVSFWRGMQVGKQWLLFILLGVKTAHINVILDQLISLFTPYLPPACIRLSNASFAQVKPLLEKLRHLFARIPIALLGLEHKFLRFGAHLRPGPTRLCRHIQEIVMNWLGRDLRPRGQILDGFIVSSRVSRARRFGWFV